MATLSDPEFAPPRTLPFPAGASPFRQKGNAYLGDRQYLDSVVPGGFAAAVAGIADPGARRFFEQPFRASEWYDAYPGALIEQSAARLTGATFERHRVRTGRWHAANAARGLYGALLRLVSNESVAVWAPRISAIYFEFGRTQTQATGTREVTGWRTGIPRELAQWMGWVVVGFGEATLEAAGARAPRLALGEVLPDGTAHGRELVRLQFTLRWS